MRIRIIDFETTGQPPDADVVEAAYQDIVVAPAARIVIDDVRRAGAFMSGQWEAIFTLSGITFFIPFSLRSDIALTTSSS